MEKKKKVTTVLTILAFVLIVIGIVIGLVIVQSQNRTNEKSLKSIAEKMKQVQNFQFDLSGNYAGNKIEITAKAIREGNMHSLYAKTNLQTKAEQESMESEIQYDFDLIEQRYLQKILYQGKVIHTNSFSSTEENPLDVDILDATRLLAVFSDFLIKKNPTTNGTQCTISITEEDVNQFWFMMELLTFHISEEVLSSDSLQLTYKLNKEKKIIEEISFYQEKNKLFQLTFHNFGKTTLS